MLFLFLSLIFPLFIIYDFIWRVRVEVERGGNEEVTAGVIVKALTKYEYIAFRSLLRDLRFTELCSGW